jgi:excisionase family DNA binding protein
LREVADRPQNAVRLSERAALTIPEAAASLGVSERHLRTVLPEIPHFHLGGRVLIPQGQLVEWMRREVDREQHHSDEIVRKVVEAVTRD